MGMVLLCLVWAFALIEGAASELQGHLPTGLLVFKSTRYWPPRLLPTFVTVVSERDKGAGMARRAGIQEVLWLLAEGRSQREVASRDGQRRGLRAQQVLHVAGARPTGRVARVRRGADRGLGEAGRLLL